jgi:hypothetical protein
MNDSNIKKIMRNIAIENSKLDERGNRFGYKKKVSNVSLMSEENFNKMLGFKIDGYADVSATEKQPVEVVTTDVSNFKLKTNSKSNVKIQNHNIPGEYKINTPKGTPLNYNNSVWTSDIPSDVISDNIRRMGSSYVMTHVRAQGHCGSCWAFSLITACEIAWFLAGGEKQALSVQSILDCDYYQLSLGESAPQSINVANPRKAVGPFDSSYSELMDMVPRDNYNQKQRCHGNWTANAVMSLLHRDPDGGIPSEEDYPYIERGVWNKDQEFAAAFHAVHACKMGNLNSTAIKPTCFVNSVEYPENGESDSGLYDLLQAHGHVCVNIRTPTGVHKNWSKDYGGGIIDVFQEAYNDSMIRDQGRPYLDLNKYRDYLIHNSNHAVTLVGCGEVTSDYYNKGNRNDEHEQQFPIGTKYWIIRNSWGKDWGEPYDGGVIGGGGYFRVKRYSSNERLTSDNINFPALSHFNVSEETDTFHQALYDYIGIIGPMSINLMACSITVRKSLIPYAPSSQSIRGCTDIGQLCEFSYDSAHPYNYTSGICLRDNTNPNKLRCYDDARGNIEGFSVGAQPSGTLPQVTLEYTVRPPVIDANLDDYTDSLIRPSGLVNYETLKCHTRDDQRNWIENDNIGGSACTTHNCINDNEGLYNALLKVNDDPSYSINPSLAKFRGHNRVRNGNICNYVDCDELDNRLPGKINNVSHSEYYCPEKCLHKHYRLNDDGTVANDDIYICPNKKRNTPSAYEPCSTVAYTDPDHKGNCSPLDGFPIDNNPSIITYGGHTGLSKRTE